MVPQNGARPAKGFLILLVRILNGEFVPGDYDPFECGDGFGADASGAVDVFDAKGEFEGIRQAASIRDHQRNLDDAAATGNRVMTFGQVDEKLVVLVDSCPCDVISRQ